MELETIIDDIFHVRFPTRLELGSTFVRIQEHYESPQFRGKVFTLAEFERWYIENSSEGKKTGTFTYYTDWVGFNVPGDALDPFFKGGFDPLSKQEKNLLRQFEGRMETPFYVIGTAGKAVSRATMRHEISHGLFYLHDNYKEAVLRILEQLPPEDQNNLIHYLEQEGYHPHVHNDEMHAYLLADRHRLSLDGIRSISFKAIHQQLERLFREYVPEQYWVQSKQRNNEGNKK